MSLTTFDKQSSPSGDLSFLYLYHLNQWVLFTVLLESIINPIFVLFSVMRHVGLFCRKRIRVLFLSTFTPCITVDRYRMVCQVIKLRDFS